MKTHRPDLPTIKSLAALAEQTQRRNRLTLPLAARETVSAMNTVARNSLKAELNDWNPMLAALMPAKGKKSFQSAYLANLWTSTLNLSLAKEKATPRTRRAAVQATLHVVSANKQNLSAWRHPTIYLQSKIMEKGFQRALKLCVSMDHRTDPPIFTMVTCPGNHGTEERDPPITA